MLNLTGMLASFVLLVVWLWVKERQIAEERNLWVEERRELLNRIQHPEIVPVVHEERVIEAREPDELSLVGVVIDE
jgi:hypothetical protein